MVILVALLATGMVASSNYVLKELLDAKFDGLHPVKKNRPIPSGLVNKPIAFVQWIVFGIIGLGISLSIGNNFFYCCLGPLDYGVRV